MTPSPRNPRLLRWWDFVLVPVVVLGIAFCLAVVLATGGAS